MKLLVSRVTLTVAVWIWTVELLKSQVIVTVVAWIWIAELFVSQTENLRTESRPPMPFKDIVHDRAVHFSVL